ncbi:MAG: transcription termination/antitermination NusG family protein [Bacteroidota bacterium]|nr:transcription termination/antitermination NusG family protein [Bacteroidota bacterium]
MQNHWYVVYTKPCCERKVAVLLNKKRIENYFPLNYKRSQSFVRKRIIEEPLFKSYLFVKTTEINIITITKQIKNIISLLHWIGKPAIINEDEIIAIKEFTNNHQEIRLEKVHVNLKICENIMDGISYIMDGKILMAKPRAIKLNLPSLGFSMTARMDDQNIIRKGIMLNKKESLVQS